MAASEIPRSDNTNNATIEGNFVSDDIWSVDPRQEGDLSSFVNFLYGTVRYERGWPKK